MVERVDLNALEPPENKPGNFKRSGIAL